MKPKIILIHGMFLNSRWWDKWIKNFESLGYPAEAPDWPLHEGDPTDLRQMIPTGLGRLTLDAVLSHYRTLIEQEPEPPIIIGHSMGGLLMQKLIAEGLGRAGVGICSVPPNRMIASRWSFLRSDASISNPLAGNEPCEIMQELFHRYFGNTMTATQSRMVYQQFAVHESRQILRAALGTASDLNMDRPHPPLLFIGAERDRIVPASLARRNARDYSDKHSHHEYKEVSSRGHFFCVQDGWEKIALEIVNWLDARIDADTPTLASVPS